MTQISIDDFSLTIGRKMAVIAWDLPAGVAETSETVDLTLRDGILVATDAERRRTLKFGPLGPMERELVAAVSKISGVEKGPHGELAVGFRWMKGA